MPIGWQWEKPTDYRDTLYFGAVRDPKLVFWPEGEKDADTLDGLKLSVFTLGGVVTDWFEKGGGTRERLIEIVNGLRDWQPSADGTASEGFDSFDSTEGSRFSEWPEPKPLPKGLPPVASFDPDFHPTRSPLG